MSIFTLSRRMGTSVQMIDATYGHLARDAEDQDRGMLDAYDSAENGRGHVVGTISAETEESTTPRTRKPRRVQGLLERAREDSNL
jgi:hypothetical protein